MLEKEDNMLVDMNSQSNEDVRNTLYQKYLPLIRHIVKKYKKAANNLGYDYSDLLQEANLAFTDAINNFDQEKDASLKTFVILCIERKMLNLLFISKNQKHQIAKDSLSLNYEYLEDGSTLEDKIADSSLDPLTKFSEEFQKDKLINEIKAKLSDSEKEVFMYMIEGMNYQEIAVKLEKNPKQIDNTIQRVKIKVKKILEGERNV